jgi:2-(1,2-epoxy-1,2-dihydrophenyl)acetyl-CoA isomerase
VNVRHVVDAGIGWVMLDRPQRMNAITEALGLQLKSAISELGSDPAVNVIVIQGAGGNFCAGGDFHEVERLRAEGPRALHGLFAAFREACEAMASVPIPVIAAVEGVAAAGGFELMQAADIVLVADQARIADSHVNFGMIPGGGSTARLPRLVGRQQALGLLLSGEKISGIDAVRQGLAYRSFPQSEFADGVKQFATVLAGRNRSSVVAIKRLVYDGLGSALCDALDAETQAVVSHIGGESGVESVQRFEATRKGVAR